MTRINELLARMPHGAVVTQPWLQDHGVSKRRAARLSESRWLVRVGHGAYARAGDRLTWEGGVFGLQYGQEPQSPRIWPGGSTALALGGFTHYLALGHETLRLYAQPRARLPKWFAEASWGVRVELHAPRLFDRPDPDGFTEYTPPGRDYAIHVSSPERAVLEWLHATPADLLFGSDAVDTFSGLATLRPRRLQRLLEACTSIRVKRAFLVLARHAQHAWYKRLDIERLDLGAGKRQLIPGGKLDREFLVTVPEAFAHGV